LLKFVNYRQKSFITKGPGITLKCLAKLQRLAGYKRSSLFVQKVSIEKKGLGKIVTRSEHSAYMMSGNELSQVQRFKKIYVRHLRVFVVN
jgi:hypothetical protein